MHPERYFRTSSFPLTVFLYAKGFPIVGMTADPYTRTIVFAFRKTARLEELVELYRYGPYTDPDLEVSARVYEQARREIEALKRLNA